MDEQQYTDNTNQAYDDHSPAGFGSPPDSPTPAQGSTFDTPSPTSNDNSGSANSDELVEIKKQALAQLAPLVKNLDQDPEEKFKTIMMMVQVSDNRSLLKDAFEAAEKIPDAKAKAQALLDIVNEINYFSRPT